MQTAVPSGTAVFRGKRKRTDSRFAAFRGRGSFVLPFLRTEMPLRDIPVFRMAYFPIPHRPTFGAPVFRSAYSASRNARASAAFAASIKPYYGLCSKTLDLQPLCGLRKGAGGNLSVCCGSQLPLRRGAEGNPSVCYAASSPYAGELRATSQSATAASSPYILRTDSALRAAPVLRSAYLTSSKRSTFSRFAACERESRATPQSAAATILLEKGS